MSSKVQGCSACVKTALELISSILLVHKAHNLYCKDICVEILNNHCSLAGVDTVRFLSIWKITHIFAILLHAATNESTCD